MANKAKPKGKTASAKEESPREKRTRYIEVSEAISSLYKRVPKFTSCRYVRTRKTVELNAKIAARKAELEGDKILVALQKELKQEQQAVITIKNDYESRISELQRRLRLRGVSEDLIKQIELLSSEELPEVLADDCN